MSLRKELEEQARLNGMGAERELALMAKVERLLREIERWKQEHHFQAELTKQLMPYQDRAVKAEQELSAVRELMNTYNLGGWTDALGPMKRAQAAEAEVERFRGLLRWVSSWLEDDDPIAIRIKAELGEKHG